MMYLKEYNGKTINLGELISGIKNTLNSDSIVYVPMYQRNYKWDKVVAVNFINELLVAYKTKKAKSISLFTLYIDDKNNIQIVDGQQRMVTLSLLFNAIGKAHEFINLEFERDFLLHDKHKRNKFITEQTQSMTDETVALSDKRRLLYNSNGIKEILRTNDMNFDTNEFIDYLKNKITLLLHITNDKPVSEFLNLNCNKTKFSICDRIRAALITYPTFNKIDDEQKKLIASTLECSDYKKGISELFEEITRLLYVEDIYRTIKLGYKNPDETNENRMNIMFCNLVNNIEKGYMNCKSIENIDKSKLLIKLVYYKKMLKELEEDCNTYQTHRAFINFYKFRKIRFFELLDHNVDNNFKDNLYDILHREHSIDKQIVKYMNSNPLEDDIYFVNSYFEVLSSNKNPRESDNDSSLLKIYFKNIDKDKSKYFCINKDLFEDIAHSSGKYILYRYINERHKENENMINFPPKLLLEELQNDDKDYENKFDLKKITVGELLKKDITIPVIQREYCMGSHFNTENNNDMLEYIIECFKEDKDITLSAITILPYKNIFYVYDGQQRIVTLACLVKLLNSNYEIKGIFFEHRKSFNIFIKDFFENNVLKVDSYASKSVDNLKKVIDKRLKANYIDKDKFCTFILNKIKLDVITVSGELSTAEQFFVEINDGVQLVPYEIFKCKINARFEQLMYCDREKSETCKVCDVEGCPSINESTYKEWISCIDNEWLDFFYKLNNTILDDESAIEELMEMRFIEFCCRMIFWEKYVDLQDKSSCKHPCKIERFSKDGQDMGDMDILINQLELEDFIRISSIMKELVLFKNESNIISCIEKDFASDNKSGFSHYNPINYDREYLLKKFLDSLRKDELDYHDVIIWGVLNRYDSEIIKDLMNYWNNKKINKKNFAVLYPRFIGIWHHVCLQIPKYYLQDTNDLIEKALAMECIDDIEKEYDDVMKHLCLKSNQGTVPVKWGNYSSRYATRMSDINNIAESNVYYYRTGKNSPEKIENRIVVSSNNYPNYIALANNKDIVCALTTLYPKSSRFMKGIGKIISIEIYDSFYYEVTIETRTKDWVYTKKIKILK